MDDDDDSGLLDFIGDQQALNYFLHGSDSKSLTDSKSSGKSVQSLAEEESSDGLQLSNSIQFFEDDLGSSSIPDLSEDILQKSLQEANITEQILAEEAYLDASIGSSQQFANVPLNSHSSASFTQTTSAPNYSGQTLHPVGVTHTQVGASFASNTVGAQHGFMQQVGIIPSQHMPNSNQSSSGQIHLIGSINNQTPMMTINNLDGSHIILKSGQQAPANAGGGLLVQRHTPNGNAMFGSPNTSPARHSVTVPFNSGHFQTSLPVHNIIIHRGPAPNASKGPINIQPKPVQVGQQASYNVNHLGIQHHRQQGVHFIPANSAQSSPVGQKMPVNHQGPHMPSGQQSGGSIVIHSPLGHTHGHHNQFLIPTGLSVNPSSVQHIQTINKQLVQTQASQLGPHQVHSEQVMMNRNTAAMVRPNQQYPGQMINNPGTAVQFVSGQTFTGSGGQVILNHGQSQVVGGQMSQVSPTLLHLSPGQGNTGQSRSSMSSAPSGCPNLSPANRFTVLSSGTMLQGMGPSFQSPGGGGNYIVEQQQNRPQSAVSDSHRQVASAMPNSMFCPSTSSQQSFSCNQGQNKMLNNLSPVSPLKNQDRQPHAPDHSSGNKHLQHHLLSQESLMASQLQNAEVEGCPGGLKRPATNQLTRESLLIQQLCKDQERSVLPVKGQFQSLHDAAQRLLPYHVFQGSMPTEEDLHKVDTEFESMATHFLKKTQAMLNKYRLLLMEDAMRINPSAEMVMLDRMFNQEERATLTREKRMALVDPDGYLAEFCCTTQLQEDSSEAKLLSNHSADAVPTLACPMANVAKHKTNIGPSNDDTPCLVPNNNLSSHKRKYYSDEKDSLNEDGTLKNPSLSPCEHLADIYRLKGKYTECSSDLDASSRTSKETDSVVNAQMSIPGPGLNVDTSDVEHPQGKTPGPSLETVGEQRDIAASPGNHCKSLARSKTIKQSVRDVVELKLSAKRLKSEVNSSNSAELEFVKCPATSSEENCVDKQVAESREGAVETDSVLEAAVNSILEC
ncbi:BRD4-interacting chromatin-remodeling complex-associated protein-like [Pseudophryne corroboree]|uniref:BRD4-interacting chromatin-remodeling complex-associated protein-like n=1 Tax=Pseudophryne corroboree TaxID=495146 RepID=UPI0030815FF2